LQDQNFEEQKELIIEESQFSLTMCGRDEYRWSGYAFASSNAEENDGEDEDQSEGENEDEEDQDESDNDDEEEEPSFTLDPISSGALDAEYIRNPREYFLEGLNNRLLKSFNCFKDTAKVLEYSITHHVSLPSVSLLAIDDFDREANPSALVDNLEKQDHHSVDFPGSFDKFSHIAAECRKTAERIHIAGVRFSKQDRLIFADLSSFPEDLRSKIAGMLVSISKTFEKFEDLRSVLCELERTCSQDAENAQAQRSQLNLTLTMNNNEMAKHHGFIACFTLLVSVRSGYEAMRLC
jgi:hypothetical protein